ncbi:MAG: hypothetical protein PHW32_01785 [Bacilli bacterium]|nr:hypothetical protein [Bacilli bacterium]MDD4282317.1 hypothetical protein [Bacilli bacterium]MDD4718321.1 hypothetical protein [Bacilli bacterium]
MTIEKRNYIFILLSTLARGMIEVFIPIYLYQAGFSLTDIFTYFLFMLIISFIICYPLVWLGSALKYKYLIFFSLIFLIITYFVLLKPVNTILYIIILSIVYSLYRRTYWIGRRYYSLKVIPTENMGSKVGIIVIINQFAGMVSSYLGALILNNTNKMILFNVSIFIFILGVSFLIKIPEKKNNEKVILNLRKNIKNIPINNIIFMILNEAIYICSFVFPLYLFLYVASNFEYIGIFNIFVGISSVIFIHFFSKKMDKDKSDYKYIAYIGLGIVYILKVNYPSTTIILLIALMEGIFSKMQNVAFTRNVYYLGSHYNKSTYNLVCELVQNFARLLLFFTIFIFTKELKTIIYICAFLIIFSSVIKFDDGEGGYI